MRFVVTSIVGMLLGLPVGGGVVSGPLGAELDDYLKTQEADGFYGAVVVARAGEIVLANGYGWADRDARVPATEDTAFSTGSITKQFTAAAIMVLAEQGRLSTEDPITRHFEGVPADKQGITLHHLLTHTAGFPGAIGDDYAPVGREEFVRLAMEAPLKSPPGERYRYSNVGYSLLGAIVEQISGMGYERFLRRHLFEPAGMTQTGYRLPEYQRLAHGYRDGQDWGTMLDQNWAEDGPYWHLRANGGIVSTPMDMYRWMQALRSGEIVSDASREKMFTPFAEEDGAGSHYGYGWSIADTRWGRLITHNGGNGIFRAELQWFVEPDVFVYICGSRSDRSPFPLLRRIDRMVMGEPEPAEGPAVALPATPGGQLVGRFLEQVRKDDADAYVEFLREAFPPELFAKYPEERHRAMFANLRTDVPDSTVRAVRESDGKLELLMQRADSGWLKLNFDLEGEGEDVRIGGLTVDGIPEYEALTLLEEMSGSAKASSQEAAERDWGLPPSPTGRRASQLLDAIASGEVQPLLDEAISPELIERTPRETLEERLLETRRIWGDFELTGARKTGPSSTVLDVRTAQGEWTVTLALEENQPHRILEVGIQSGPAGGEEWSGPSMSSFEELDAHLRESAEAERFSGVVLADRGGEIVFHRAYGLASKRFGVANQLDTRFNIGSLNKMFTAVGVLQLADQGKLSLDDPIAKYLEGFPPDVGEKVTIRHLLAHRSGWSAYWDNPVFLARRTELRSMADYLEFIRDIPLEFEPGTRKQYSNTGYEVLGAIIEAASGQGYYEYIDEHVYRPAGMSRSGSFELDRPAPGTAVGYTNQSQWGPREGFVRENSAILPARGTAAGGGYSTAEDLWRFTRALLDGRLVEVADAYWLLSDFAEERPDGPRGVTVGFGGGAEGINATIELDTGSNTLVVVVSNYDPPTAGRAARLAFGLLARQ